MDLEALNRQVIACRRCPRLVAWREAVAHEKRKAYSAWEYWGRPVPGFGDARARILVVGLAPGAHGSNRTGRQFTGDASGRFLYPALFRAGFASQSESITRDDNLRLRGLYLSAACRCVPPGNKPSPAELANCRPYLEQEIELLCPRVIVCLGRIAFLEVLRVHALRPSDFAFGHGLRYRVPSGPETDPRWLLCSYHPSQQNTLTGRLTAEMFDGVWHAARELAGDASF
jgi:uracil-DNA glycosylase family 4